MRERERVPVEQPPEHISELSITTSLGSPPLISYRCLFIFNTHQQKSRISGKIVAYSDLFQKVRFES
jgi:hypothetical protein